MKYVLISQRNNDSEKSWGNPSILEVGAEGRLRGYMNGIVKGLQMAGYVQQVGLGPRIAKMSKDSETVKILLLSESEWKKYE